MAFTVTPASGSAPYLFEASFDNPGSFGYGYTAVLRFSSPVVGSCPPPANATNVVAGAGESLVNTGSYLRTTGSVPADNCNVYRLDVVDSDNIVVSQMSVNINNVV